MKLNPDEKRVQQIQKALEKTNGYCPCRVQRTEDNICPCKDMREKDECICGLYVKDDK